MAGTASISILLPSALMASALFACSPAAPLEPKVVSTLSDAGDVALPLDTGAPDPSIVDASAPDGDPAAVTHDPPDAGEVADATPRAEWRVRVLTETEVLAPEGSEGCLARSAQTLAPGEMREVLASDGRFFLLDADGRCVASSAVQVIDPLPEPPPPALRGVVQNTTSRYVYDARGCPTIDRELGERTEVDALARSSDSNYRGFVVIDRALGLAPVRMVDAPGWTYPWHASVQIVKQVPEGFIIAGGVLIGPNAIATAAHVAVDETYCYSREPYAGDAWDNHLFECANIAGPAETHPGGVDIAIVHLIQPEPPPYARVRSTPLAVGEAFYTSNLSTLRTHAFTDSTVAEVTSQNALCQTWPDGSSFFAADLVVGPGDSGGPAFVGDEAVGVVHGQLCRRFWEPERHVFVHLPGVRAFLAPALAP